MEKAFTASEAEELIRQTNSLLSDLEKSVRLDKEYPNDIKILSDRLLAEEKYPILKEIPVEEINRGKRGFRIKTLKEAGYLSLAEVISAGPRQLAQINGIGPRSAREILAAAAEISDEAAGHVKIRLSQEHKSDRMSALVNAIHRYLKSQGDIRTCKAISKKYRSSLREGAEDLACRTAGPLQWLLASGSDKKKAADAYEYLKVFVDGEAGRDLRQHISSLNQTGKSTTEEGWADFNKNPVPFFTALEKINPGVLDTGDAPEEVPKLTQTDAEKE